MPNNNTNNPVGSVPSGATFWSSLVNEAPGAYKIGNSLYNTVRGKGPLDVAVNASSTYGLLRNRFPQTFNNQTLNDLAPYTKPARNVVNGVERIRSGDVFRGLQDVTGSYNDIRNRNPTDLPRIPSNVNVDLGLSIGSAAESAVRGRYPESIVRGAGAYNQAITSGAIKGTPINSNVVGGATGALNLQQGIKNKDYGQAAIGATQVYESGSQALGNAASGVADVLPYAGAAYSAYNAAKILGGDGTAKEKSRAIIRQGENAVADFYTFGGASAADALLHKFAPGIAKPVDKLRNLNSDFTGVGFVLPKVIGLTGSGKTGNQLTRDQYRGAAIEAGIMDKDYQLELADGTKFDAGADGSKLNVKEIAKEKGFDEAAAVSDTLASGLGFQGKQREAIALLFAKASLSNGKTNDNLKNLAKQHGLDGNKIQDSLDKQKADGEITDEQYAVWSSKAKDLFGGRGKLADKGLDKEKDKGKEIDKLPVTVDEKGNKIPISDPRYGKPAATVTPPLGLNLAGVDLKIPEGIILKDNVRTATKSAGIGLDGKRIKYKK